MDVPGGSGQHEGGAVLLECRAVVSRELWKLPPMATTQRSKFRYPREPNELGIGAVAADLGVGHIGQGALIRSSSFATASTSCPRS